MLAPYTASSIAVHRLEDTTNMRETAIGGMTLPTPEERSAIRSVALILNEFRKVHPEIGTQQCMTLLAIAEEPGLTVTELSRKTGIGLASMSRHIEILGPHRALKGVGWGLVQDDSHPTDRRRKVITLTAQGWRIIRSLEHIISNLKH